MRPYDIVWTTDGSAPASIIMASLGTLPMNNITIHQRHTCRRSLRCMFINILCGLQQCEHDIVFICEHDVLYPRGYFDADLVTDAVTYSEWGVFLSAAGFRTRTRPALSSLAGDRKTLMRLFHGKLAEHYANGKVGWCELTAPDGLWHMRKATAPYVDVRHGMNYTGGRDGGMTCQNVLEWGNAGKLWEKIGGGK